MHFLPNACIANARFFLRSYLLIDKNMSFLFAGKISLEASLSFSALSNAVKSGIGYKTDGLHFPKDMNVSLNTDAENKYKRKICQQQYYINTV